MNTKTTVLLALLVVLGGVLMVLERPWEDVTRAREEAEKERLTGQPQRVIGSDVEYDTIERVELTVGNDPTIRCRREEDDWRVTAPIECVAEAYIPRQIANRCLDLKYVQRYGADDEGAPTRVEAGLESPLSVVTLHRKDDEPITFRFGRQAPLSTNYYAAVEGDPHIYVVVEDVRRTFMRPLEDFRSKKLFRFAGDEVTSVTVAGGRNYEIVRREDDGWLIEKPVRARAERGKASTLVSTLRNLRAVEFVDDEGKSLVPYGLDRPSYTVTLVVEKEIKPEPPNDAETEVSDDATAEAEEETPAPAAEPAVERTTHTLLIGGPAGENRYAKLADQPWVFTIGKYVLNNLTPDLTDLRDRKLCDFSAAQVEKIELQVDGQQETIEKEQGQWVLASGHKAEPITVDDLLKTVADLKASSFEDTPPLVDTGLETPRATVSLTVRGRTEPVRVLVGFPTASGKMVYVRSDSDPTIAILRAESVEPLLAPTAGYHDRQILSFNKAMASRIEITREETTFVLTSSDDGLWRLSSPIEAPADADSVSNILADLNNLRAVKVVAADSGSACGLDDPWVRAVLTVKSLPKPQVSEASEPPQTATQPAGAETQPAAPETQPTTQVVWVEQPPRTYGLLMAAAPDGKIYARLEDGELVYQVDHTVLDNLLAELHDRTAIPINDPDAVTRVTFVNNDRTLTLEKIGEKWVCDVDPVLPIDAGKVTTSLKGLAQLKTGKFVSYQIEDLSEFGLDDPALTVTVTDTQGRSVELRVSGKGPPDDPDQSRYATLAGSGKVFLLTPDDLGGLNVTVSDFEKTE